MPQPVYMRKAYNQQILIEVHNAFNNTPPNRHEQMASDLMSALASYLVHAARLCELGLEECARRGRL